MVGVMETSPAEGGPAAAVIAQERIDLDPQTLENQRVKEEVLKRIDVMPGLTGEEKDKLYVQVERARAMGKVITIPFSSGRTAINESDAAALGEKLKLGQIANLTDDPTVVFVVLGFADKKGDPEKNREISLARAESVLKTLRDRFRVMNVMHAVGMGSSEMFDAENLDKNRVVELWAVLP
jgi:Outer membrane protein and related peptidoglycan-associated (lipo)proteins